MRKPGNMLLVPSALAAAKAAEQVAKDALGKASMERRAIEKDSRVICEKCGNNHAIKDLTYYQTQWYVRPYSCTEGDYWRDGEGQWNCSCGYVNRLHDSGGMPSTNSYIESEMDVVNLRTHFKEIVRIES